LNSSANEGIYSFLHSPKKYWRLQQNKYFLYQVVHEDPGKRFRWFQANENKGGFKKCFTLFGFNGLSSAKPISSKNTTDCVKEVVLLFVEFS